ncbi:hypothetical protein [Sphingomonas sp.]|jgi:hypothetical protein|uniref:hypothetical protein n=1 Tax=Sphingomonas sp. TaxID=28214 RepID=UPI002DE529E5|nr:hypothetical protein [Sphingomonas sp.]
MRDEHDDRIYQAFRGQLGNDIARLVKSVAYAFDRLTARLYDAPWSKGNRAVEGQCGKGFTTL